MKQKFIRNIVNKEKYGESTTSNLLFKKFMYCYHYLKYVESQKD